MPASAKIKNVRLAVLWADGLNAISDEAKDVDELVRWGTASGTPGVAEK